MPFPQDNRLPTKQWFLLAGGVFICAVILSLVYGRWSPLAATAPVVAVIAILGVIHFISQVHESRGVRTPDR